jgi:hypothetical protein
VTRVSSGTRGGDRRDRRTTGIGSLPPSIGSIAGAEEHLRRFSPVSVGHRYANECARLSTTARRRGIAISENDLWIAATASLRERTLVTSDRDHLRIAAKLSAEVLYLAPPV